MDKKSNKGDVAWYIKPKSKRPSMYSTKAESDTLKVMLEEFGDFREILNRNYILSPTERAIIDASIKEGNFKPNIQ